MMQMLPPTQTTAQSAPSYMSSDNNIPNDSLMIPYEIVRILSQPSGEAKVGRDRKVRDDIGPGPGRATHALVAPVSSNPLASVATR